MADHGKLYNGIQKKDVESRKKLMQIADCIFPNKTEACLLADLKTVPDNFNLDEAKELICSLTQKGAKSICITSMKIEEKPCIFLYEEKHKGISYPPLYGKKVYSRGDRRPFFFSFYRKISRGEKFSFCRRLGSSENELHFGCLSGKKSCRENHPH